MEYGLTADTGGHIRYLLDLVDALSREGRIRQTIVTRGFIEPTLGARYAEPRERLSNGVTIVRLLGGLQGYLAKEDLWRDMPVLTVAFLRHLARTGVPDLIHAHYADAGTLAYAAKARFGVPYLFTAHSLGRIKRLNMGTAAAAVPDLAQTLARREAVEDQAIAAADLIIASSRDEAEGQYGTYRSARPERIRVIAPGCDLSAYRATVPVATAGAVARRIAAELDAPERPPILALARPVWRKNLNGLIEAYGRDPWLRANVNLVVFAGSSHDGAMLSAENRAVIAELKAAVARLGLAGRVALPSHHHADEVPAIYAFARERRGVFANPALHEPFGLTLIEAAAAGLPVVATDRGGPRDILADCRHGLLADPTDPSAVADALRSLLEDREAARSYAEAGARHVSRYTWTRHARQYVRAAARTMSPSPPVSSSRAFQSLLVSDIDGTLVGHGDGLERLTRWLEARPRVLFGIATGRSFHDAVGVLTRHGAPVPAVMITSVGSEIYLTTDDEYGAVRDEGWSEHIGEDWYADAVVDTLATDRRLTPQPAMEQRAFKRSWFGALRPSDVAEIEAALGDAQLPATVIYSHGRFLDVLPQRASKGQALVHLRKRFGLSRSATASAGDSGNDRDLLTAAGRGVVVANHNAELAGLRGTPGVVFARAGHADGIVEGLAGWPHADGGEAGLRPPPVGRTSRAADDGRM
ncbi:HAD-IIB family hydrolase [Acuticoccus sp.]|uniref:HAD-IIB family hydrolase n=1 Tax=Acuticoccus sp. TaxID=1904378 RepID=UPI003B515997